RAQAELIRARALLALGRAGEAAASARAALAIGRRHEVPWLTSAGHHLLAGVARASGKLGRALRECDAAIATVERVQSRLAFELRSHFLEDKLPIYDDAIDLCLRLAQPERALEYLERAKSRALVDYLASHPDVRIRARGAADGELVAELTRLRDEHHWFYRQLYGGALGARPDGGPGEAEAGVLRAAIREREKRIGRILERLASEAAAELEGVPLPYAARQTARPALDSGSVLLEYY